MSAPRVVPRLTLRQFCRGERFGFAFRLRDKSTGDALPLDGRTFSCVIDSPRGERTTLEGSPAISIVELDGEDWCYVQAPESWPSAADRDGDFTALLYETTDEGKHQVCAVTIPLWTLPGGAI